jgi:hypothetical protein
MDQINESPLVQKIENAFPNSAYPGDDNLVHADSVTYPEAIEIKRKFHNKHWRDLTLETIRNGYLELSWFTPDAFCFYLPGFLIAAITYPIEIIDVFPSSIIFALAPDEDSEWHNNKLTAIVNCLDMQQRRMVVDFLDWYTHKFVLDVPGYPEDLKDLKRYHGSLYRAMNFWKNIVSSV